MLSSALSAKGLATSSAKLPWCPSDSRTPKANELMLASSNGPPLYQALAASSSA